MGGRFGGVQQSGSPVHNVVISDYGLAYVADRGNKRVQVFTPDGKFIAEQFVGLDSKYPCRRGLLPSRSIQPNSFLYVAGTPRVFLLNRRTLEVLGSFNIGSPQGDPQGHLIAVDHKGNLYAVQAELSGADGHSGGAGAYKFTFKWLAPRVPCPPCQSTSAAIFDETTMVLITSA
jgi:DNA-binding beta-propeller fold protein YncE